MSIFSKAALSGAPTGNLVNQITSTSTPGETVHDAGTASTTTEFDEVWLWATNTSISGVLLTLEVGGTGAGNEVKVNVPASSSVPVLQGLPVNNSANIDAYATTGSVLNLYGFVNTIRDDP